MTDVVDKGLVDSLGIDGRLGVKALGDSKKDITFLRRSMGMGQLTFAFYSIDYLQVDNYKLYLGPLVSSALINKEKIGEIDLISVDTAERISEVVKRMKRNPAPVNGMSIKLKFDDPSLKVGGYFNCPLEERVCLSGRPYIIKKYHAKTYFVTLENFDKHFRKL